MMPDFDPEEPSLAEITPIEPSSIQWPRLLSLLRGLIQPRALLSGIRAFPTSVRLPGLSTLPSLGMHVARRWMEFAQERLPFLTARAPAERAGTAPEYEYRTRPRPSGSRFATPFNLTAHPVGESLPGDLETESVAELGEYANEGLEEHLASGFESFLTSSPISLGHEMARAVSSPRAEIAPAAEPVYLEAEAWRELVPELPHAVQPIGLERQAITAPSHPTVIRELASSRTSQRIGEEETAGRTNLSEPAAARTQVLDLTREILARQGIPDLLAAPEASRRVQPATAIYRQLSLPSAGRRELPAGELSAALEKTGSEGWPSIHGLEERATEIGAHAAPVSPAIDYAALGAVLPFGEQGTMLGEVLARHEGVLPDLLHAGTLMPAVAATSLTHFSESTLTGEAPRLQGLMEPALLGAQVRRELPALNVSQHLEAVAAHVEPAPLQILRHLLPVQAGPATAALEALSGFGAVERLAGPATESLQALPSIGAAERLTESARPAMTALLGESLSSVQASAPAVGELLRESARTAMGTLLGQSLAGVQAIAPAAAETLGAAISTGERTMLAPVRTELASLHGTSSLGQELTHAGQLLAPGSLAGTLAGSFAAGHTAQQHEPVAERHPDQGVVPPPDMQLRREAPAHPIQAYGSPGGPTMSQWSGEANAQEIESVSAPAPVFAEPEVAPNETPAPSEAGSSGVAPMAGVEESLAASPNLAAVARQVYAILKNELRAERDRHQLYGR
jgi:hypothetical protein